MPFKSEAQRRWMYANEPEMARRWEKHTPKGKKLPEHVDSDDSDDTKAEEKNAATVQGAGAPQASTIPPGGPAPAPAQPQTPTQPQTPAQPAQQGQAPPSAPAGWNPNIPQGSIAAQAAPPGSPQAQFIQATQVQPEERSRQRRKKEAEKRAQASDIPHNRNGMYAWMVAQRTKSASKHPKTVTVRAHSTSDPLSRLVGTAYAKAHRTKHAGEPLPLMPGTPALQDAGTGGQDVQPLVPGAEPSVHTTLHQPSSTNASPGPSAGAIPTNSPDSLPPELESQVQDTATAQQTAMQSAGAQPQPHPVMSEQNGPAPPQFPSTRPPALPTEANLGTGPLTTGAASDLRGGIVTPAMQPGAPLGKSASAWRKLAGPFANLDADPVEAGFGGQGGIDPYSPKSVSNQGQVTPDDRMSGAFSMLNRGNTPTAGSSPQSLDFGLSLPPATRPPARAPQPTPPPVRAPQPTSRDQKLQQMQDRQQIPEEAPPAPPMPQQAPVEAPQPAPEPVRAPQPESQAAQPAEAPPEPQEAAPARTAQPPTRKIPEDLPRGGLPMDPHQRLQRRIAFLQGRPPEGFAGLDDEDAARALGLNAESAGKYAPGNVLESGVRVEESPTGGIRLIGPGSSQG